MVVFQLISFLILGLVFGSFISAFTWRYSRGISIVKGRSICPRCKKQIAWYDNIPLLSYLVLSGRCRNCKKHISFRYPLIEVVTALGFVAIIYFVSPTQTLSLQVVFSIVIFLILESIFIIDLEERIIPDPLVFLGIAISLAYYFTQEPTLVINRLFASFVAGVLLLLIHLITRGRGMGLGDVKFAILGGLIVGPKLFLIWLLLAFLTGSIVGIILILSRRAKLKSQIAFGPFLIFAIPLTLLYGEKILSWIYLS